MKIIIVQECRGLSWNLQTFYSTGEDRVKCALISSTIIHTRVTQHFHRGLLLGKTRKKKRDKLCTRESSQQAKEEQGNLFGFYF